MLSRFDPTEQYKKPFRRICDFYSPQSDRYLMTELVFKDLYSLRESLAQ
jgi:hypothetical protein